MSFVELFFAPFFVFLFDYFLKSFLMIPGLRARQIIGTVRNGNVVVV